MDKDENVMAHFWTLSIFLPKLVMVDHTVLLREINQFKFSPYVSFIEKSNE